MNPDNCMASQISLKDIKQCVNKPNVNGLCIYHYMDYVNKKVIPRMDQPLDENTIEHFLNMYTKVDVVGPLVKKYNMERMSKDELIICISGPAFLDKTCAHNDKDPISQEEIWHIANENKVKVSSDEIDKMFIFSYIDDNDHIQCFNIKSIKKLFENQIFSNPLTNLVFPEKVIDFAKIKINVLNLNEQDPEQEHDMDNIASYTLDTFQKFNSFSIFFKNEWFLKLTIKELYQMHYEIKALFHKNFDDMEKIKFLSSINNEIYQMNEIQMVQRTTLDNINKLMECNDKLLTQRAVFVILAAFAFVSKEVKDAYPDFVYL